MASALPRWASSRSADLDISKEANKLYLKALTGQKAEPRRRMAEPWKAKAIEASRSGRSHGAQRDVGPGVGSAAGPGERDRRRASNQIILKSGQISSSDEENFRGGRGPRRRHG